MPNKKSLLIVKITPHLAQGNKNRPRLGCSVCGKDSNKVPLRGTHRSNTLTASKTKAFKHEKLGSMQDFSGKASHSFNEPIFDKQCDINEIEEDAFDLLYLYEAVDNLQAYAKELNIRHLNKLVSSIVNEAPKVRFCIYELRKFKMENKTLQDKNEELAKKVCNFKRKV